MKRKADQYCEGQTATRGRVRILIVAPSVDILGGQAVQAARLISRLQSEAIFDVGFLPINPRLPGCFGVLQAIRYVRTVVTSLLYVATLCTQVRKYDVIHIFSASYFSFVLAQTPAILISKLLRKRVLLNYHSGEAADHLKRWPSAIRTIRLADELVVPSQYLVKVFADFGLRAKAINNLIELDDFRFRERQQLRPRFLTNRNLETHYGVDCVLRAFAGIQRTHPDASLTVAGTGSELSSLQALAQELGLQNIAFVGRVEPDSIHSQYDAADVYLNGSRVDNQPLSILEAFASGIPVVTTDAGGIPDMVVDGLTGFVVHVDDHESIAAKAVCVLANPDDTVTITRRAFDECQKYRWQSVNEQWNKLYESLTEPQGGVGPVSSSLIQKLGRMSFAEVRVRSSQHVKKLFERNGWVPSSRWLTDAQLLRRFGGASDRKQFESVEQLCDEFRSSPRPYFFSPFRETDATIAALRRHWPEAEAQIVESANRIVSGKFDLLGWTGLSFGTPINWHQEPVSGKISPLIHWSRIDYLNPDVCGDKKITWELNRHQYLVTLGQAYWLTKDETYARCFAEHVESWVDANPPKQGINWASSLEIAFRSIAWVWALHFFKNSPSLNDAVLTSALKCLYLNARHLEDYLSTYFSPNTHLTGEALGLFYLGTVLPEFNESMRWQETGTKILVNQLLQQVRPDGVYFEQSSYYHRYTVDFYTHFLILSRENGQSVPSIVYEKLQLLLDHLMYITRPDGTTPLFGDEDGGRLIKLDNRANNDFRAVLSNGASLFNRGDYKFVAGEVAEETLWLLGAEGLKEFENTISQRPSDTSRAFPHGGFYLMRDSWRSDANYLLFDCGPHGTLNSGHAHADALAIQFAANGVTVLEDAGTYTYTGSNAARKSFRGSAAHNVLLVDGQSSSIPDGPFSWKSTANTTPFSWLSENRFDFAEGEHDGYESLPDPVSHKRSILFLKNDYWILRDRVTASGSHHLELRFHLAPGFDVESANHGRDGQPSMLIASDGRAASTILSAFGDGTWQREEGWISHCYGRRTSAPVWAYSAVTKGNTEFVTVILPRGEAGQGTITIREVEAIGGKAFEIKKGEHRDLVLLKDPAARRIQTVHLVADFKWAWARFPLTSTELPEELVVIDGRTLELNGKKILMSASPINYLVASRSGNKFRLQTSEDSLDFRFPIANLDQLFMKSARLQS